MNHKLSAFTLEQILVGLCILGILTFMATPKFMPMIVGAKSTEAQAYLATVHMLQKNYYRTHFKYSDDLSAIRFEQEKLVTEDGSAYYVVEIVEASKATFLARATSVEDFDGDGIYNVWEIDQTKKITETVQD